MQEKLYRIAKRRHGQLNRDVVHDMFLKFGSDLPSEAYVNTCIEHAKPQPIQSKIDMSREVQDEESDQETYSLLTVAVNTVRDSFPLEVDTFLECHVNSTYKDFENFSGISRTVLEKICKFAQHEILSEYNRIKDLD